MIKMCSRRDLEMSPDEELYASQKDAVVEVI